MWRKVSKSDEELFLVKAIAFTGDAALYGRHMLRVIREWPISCEQNLTDLSVNRKAWIGHAATCLAIECPEYVTRLAWGHLSNKQQAEANLQAQTAIDEWEAVFASNMTDQICLRLF